MIARKEIPCLSLKRFSQPSLKKKIIFLLFANASVLILKLVHLLQWFHLALIWTIVEEHFLIKDALISELILRILVLHLPQSFRKFFSYVSITNLLVDSKSWIYLLTLTCFCPLFFWDLAIMWNKAFPIKECVTESSLGSYY